MNKAKNIIDTDVSFENLVLASIGKKPTHANKKGKVSPFIKSPLRYPGGKSRAVSKIIDQYIPKGLPALCRLLLVVAQ
ncbi:hypothetical protein [Candidatus Liberibacter solanacearum]|uniref:Uncharacterized protein n=1 Tax=Candidatus Liberibacter solanacearum TaxID=556287 RepID=A0A1V2N6Z3_9HYPH|nr:hypothetical protein [Candidatus Liberibacter solanacearum]ONI58473.1 hypothetical protein AYO25_05435 [Candidatus Liberibacter solanacearum]ONI58984.1 hypothetical protein AYJ09_00930 [Candidatus Liberibacter solanacearum]